jgi:hypothetical protein
MEQDIHKLADWIEKVTRETVAIERKILEWRSAEKAPEDKPLRKEKG